MFRLVAVLLLLAFVAFLPAESLYLAIAETVAGSAAAPLVGFIAEFGLLCLVATTGVVAGWAWLRDRSAFWRLVGGGVGVVLAYLSSEIIKLIVQEERPCRAVDAMTVLACPTMGDWSWPSNHSVLAGAFATACVIAVPRLRWFVAPVALLIALSRVGAGVHYLHDVFCGLALGIIVVTLTVIALQPLLDRLNAAARPGGSPQPQAVPAELERG